MNIKLFILILCAFSLLACSTGQKAVIKRDAAPAPLPKGQESLFKADFLYSPPWWQTAICLPFSSGSPRGIIAARQMNENRDKI